MADVFDLQMGKTPDRSNAAFWNGSETWVAIGDMGESKYISSSKEMITSEAVSVSGIKRVPANTVIMSFKLSVGKVAIAKSDLYTNEAIMAFNVKPGYDILPEYVYYYLKGYKWQGSNRAVMGVTLNKASISQGNFKYPDSQEQSRIVAELDLLTGIIDKQNAQLKELDNLAQSIFYDMFGDPIENPKGWSCSVLSEKCEVSSSKRVLVEDVVDSGIPFLRGTELTMLSKAGSSKDVRFTMFITQEHYERVKAITGVPKKGDILIPSINSNGFAWVVDTDSPFYFKDGRVLWVHVNEMCFASQFLKNVISRIISGTYTQLTDGATFLELKLFNIRDMVVPVPPLALQQSFAEKIQSIEKQKETIRASIADTQKLLDYTMDKYFG